MPETDLSLYPAMRLLDTHIRTLASTRVGVDYEIAIWLPPSYATGQNNYPVVYDLDGTYFDFGSATSATFGLVLGREIPDVILVGIGNRIAGFADCMRHRNRDYTPTPHPDHPGEGGAPQFLEFLETELIPFIDANYRTDPTDRTLNGYHLAGTFTLYALLKRPALFQRYNAGSVYLGFVDRALFRYEAELAQARSSLPVKLAMVATEFDTEYRPDMEVFWTLLRGRNYEGLELTTLILEGETPFSGGAPAYVRGLKAVFGYARP